MAEFSEIYRGLRKAQKKPDGFFTTFFSRPVSPVFTYIGLKLNLTPNIISFLSLCFCAIASAVLFFASSMAHYIASGLLWWIGAILDSSDGEIARYTGLASRFGLWIDSFCDRIKEFMIFGLVTYLVFLSTGKELFLLLGVLSLFSNVMSGYISDTKKLFVKKRTLEIQFSRNFAFQMVDTRDFLVTVSIMTGRLDLLLAVYGSVFVAAVLAQSFLFWIRYNNK